MPLATSASYSGGKQRSAHETATPGTAPGGMVVGMSAMSGANRAAASRRARSAPRPERAMSASETAMSAPTKTFRAGV